MIFKALFLSVLLDWIVDCLEHLEKAAFTF